jgi:D-cysteine desulfhydrase
MKLDELLAQKTALGHYPTPIQFLPRLSKHLGYEIYLKRDDITECAMSGNKIRKLEYLLHDAMKTGCEVVVTTGGVQSNHARATVYGTRRLGLQPVVVLIGDEPAKPWDGNLFLEYIAGAEVHFIPDEDFWNGCERKMREIADFYAAKGMKTYIIPMGGSSEFGHLGYLNAAVEIMEQEKSMGVKFDAAVCAVGTGGTLGGLLLANELAGFDKRIVGVNVSETAQFFRQKVHDATTDFGAKFGFDVDIPESSIEIADGFVGPGYAKTTPEGIALLKLLAKTEGVVLDPVYTGKAFQGMLSMIESKKFKPGSKILFLHTGGIYGLFPAKNYFFE